ncbi:MAG TPA: hypothetical protein VHP32_06470 [Ignavibacteria bacterium]|nr:hypothetical protein [Ignavibacteria bacterium]
MHDIVPHNHKHDTHVYDEFVLKDAKLIFEPAHHSHHHFQHKHDFLYLIAKKNDIKSIQSVNKEFSVTDVFKNDNFKQSHSQTVENLVPIIQLHEFTTIRLLRAPPVFIS